MLTLTKKANGRSYKISDNDFGLKLKWSDFEDIVSKNGTETPNKAQLVTKVSVEAGRDKCLITLQLPQNLH